MRRSSGFSAAIPRGRRDPLNPPAQARTVGADYLDVLKLAHLVVLLVLVLASAVPCTAQPLAAPDEWAFIRLINESRAQEGLAPLEHDRTLSVRARTHTVRMIERGDIFHSTGVELRRAAANAGAVAENVGVGTSASYLHGAFMRSRGHRENILGDYDSVGVGTERDIDGALYVTVVFLRQGMPSARSSIAAGLAAVPVVSR